MSEAGRIFTRNNKNPFAKDLVVVSDVVVVSVVVVVADCSVGSSISTFSVQSEQKNRNVTERNGRRGEKICPKVFVRKVEWSLTQLCSNKF